MSQLLAPCALCGGVSSTIGGGGGGGSQASTTPLCRTCIQDPQRSLTTAIHRLSLAQGNARVALEKCRGCMGRSLGLGIGGGGVMGECVSLDCPTLYAKEGAIGEVGVWEGVVGGVEAHCSGGGSGGSHTTGRGVI